MEFITVKQFEDQSKEVQKVFMDWWNPTEGDVYCNLYNNQQDNFLIVNKCQLDMFKTFKEDIKTYGFPLLTEGQLRKFIEEKTKCKTDIIYYFGDGYDLELCKEYGSEGCFTSERCIKYLGNDLLQAYWKVACIIASEEITQDKR